jgi:hypothetical protein
MNERRGYSFTGSAAKKLEWQTHLDRSSVAKNAEGVVSSDVLEQAEEFPT